jgi:hypothetical protein
MVRKCAPLHLPVQRVVEEVFGLRVQWSVDWDGFGEKRSVAKKMKVARYPAGRYQEATLFQID